MQEPYDRIYLLQMRATWQAGYRKCLENFGKTKAYASLRIMRDKYGKGIIDNMIEIGILKTIQHGKNTSKRLMSVEEVEIAIATYHPDLIDGRSKKIKNQEKK